MLTLATVTWEDTTNIAEWQTREEAQEWATAGGWICHNVGWIIYQDEDCVVLAARRVDDHEEHVGLAERIPRRAIIDMVTIENPILYVEQDELQS